MQRSRSLSKNVVPILFPLPSDVQLAKLLSEAALPLLFLGVVVVLALDDLEGDDDEVNVLIVGASDGGGSR